MALEAITKYAVMLPQDKSGLSIVVTATEMEHTFHVREHERLLLKRQHLPVLPTQVEVDAIGEGCALVQVGSFHIQHLLNCYVACIELYCHIYCYCVIVVIVVIIIIIIIIMGSFEHCVIFSQK